MEKILYDQMDWAGIEEIVYSESSDPGRLLGAHVVKEGLLIQAFLPGARTAAVKLGKEKFPMEMADEARLVCHVLFEDKREAGAIQAHSQDMRTGQWPRPWNPVQLPVPLQV